MLNCKAYKYLLKIFSERSKEVREIVCYFWWIELEGNLIFYIPSRYKIARFRWNEILLMYMNRTDIYARCKTHCVGLRMTHDQVFAVQHMPWPSFIYIQFSRIIVKEDSFSIENRECMTPAATHTCRYDSFWIALMGFVRHETWTHNFLHITLFHVP